MLKSVFEGRESVQQTYDNILIYLNSILSKDSTDELNVDLNVLEDMLTLNDNNEDYAIFKMEFFNILDKYLLLFGILIKEEKTYDVYFKTCYLLYNLSILDYYKEEVSIILHGDYNEDDKVYLLFSLYFEETSDVIEAVHTSPLFFNIIENNTKEEKTYNMDLIQRAVMFSKYDEKIKSTILFKQIMTGDKIYNLSIKNDLNLIKDELTERVFKDLINKYEYKDELEKVGDELVFTLLFYHYDVIVDLTKVLDRDYILSLFNKPILEIDSVISNVNLRLTTILNGAKDE